MIIAMNDIYKEAWAKVEGAGSYFYNNPDEVLSEPVTYPCLFRLLRTSDNVETSSYTARLQRNEQFLFAYKVDEYPDLSEEQREMVVTDAVFRFVNEMAKDKRVRVTYPATITWFRRTLSDFTLCASISISVTPMEEVIQCVN